MHCAPRGGLFFAALLLATAAAWAQSARTHYEIPAQPLASALKLLADKGDLQLVFSPDVVADMQSPSVTGEYTALEALDLLIRDSGLTYHFDGKDTVVVKRIEAAAASQLRLAQSSQPVETASDASQEPAGTELEEIVVTGTHIRGVTGVTSPTITITREDIENGGYSGLEGVFRDLPQNFASVDRGGSLNAGASRLAAANSDDASGIDLRGLGASSTLVLLNGSRRAASSDGLYVDISMIPASMIERVEVATGGHSAIYGADAVGGVVNLITRRRFDGVEAETYYGWNEAGGKRFQASLMTGAERGRGSIVAAYDFSHDGRLDLLDNGLINPLENTTATRLRDDSFPDAQRHSGFLAGQLRINDRIELYGDGLYATGHKLQSLLKEYPGATELSRLRHTLDNDIYSALAGAHIGISDAWKLDLSGSSSAVRSERVTNQFEDLGFFAFDRIVDQHTRVELSTVSATVDGPLFAMGRITPRAAFGVEHRDESIDDRSTVLASGFPADPPPYHGTRSVRSAFAELQIPLIEDGVPGLRGLDISLAGRYDDYSDFGNSFNPQFGVIFKPVMDLQVRAAYSTAFHAPAPTELSPLSAFAQVVEMSDPVNGGTSPVLVLGGFSRPDLKAEEAKVWNLGVEWAPRLAPWKVAVDYFAIEYDQRLELPTTAADFFLALENERFFPQLINRNPTAAQAQSVIDQALAGQGAFDGTGSGWDPSSPTPILSVFPGLVIFRNHLNNIADERVSGLDARFDSKFNTGLGQMTFGVNATYSLNHERRVTADSPAFDLSDRVGAPADLRFRASAGLSRGACDAFIHVNYTDSYHNVLTTPTTSVSSWTTADLVVGVDGSRLTRIGALNGFKAMINVQNLFGREPPAIADAGGFGFFFDSSNASPLGRQISVRVVKNW